MKKKMFKVLLCTLSLFVLQAIGDVLMWQVDIYDNAIIDDVENTGVYSFLSQRYDNELGAVVVACDGQGNVIAPLMLVEEPEFSDIPIDASNPWMSQAIQSWMPDEMI